MMNFTSQWTTAFAPHNIDAQPQRGFVTVTGTLPSGKSCLMLWRDCDVLDHEGISKLCDKLAINPADV